jgi:hypothetical protein
VPVERSWAERAKAEHVGAARHHQQEETRSCAPPVLEAATETGFTALLDSARVLLDEGRRRRGLQRLAPMVKAACVAEYGHQRLNLRRANRSLQKDR